MTLHFAILEYATVMTAGKGNVGGNELRTPEKLVWPSVPTNIDSLRVQSGLERLAETSLSRHPHHPVNQKEGQLPMCKVLARRMTAH